MGLNFERGPFGGWSDSFRLANGSIELVGATEVGLRIVHLGLVGGRNLFCEIEADRGASGGEQWRLYGGHRLWHAPEDAWRSYLPDNAPIQVTQHGDSVHLRQPREAETGIEKRLELHMSAEQAHVRAVHRLHNGGAWSVRLAPWALSAMAAGGSALLPLPPRGTHPEQLNPSSTLTLWPFTDLSDGRWSWGRRAIALRQERAATTPQKLGLVVPDGWAAYLLDGTLFLKLFERREGASYPDLGSNVEIFSNDVMLEVETLGPLRDLEPGAEAVHVEDWFVFGDVAEGAGPDETLERLLPLVERARSHLATVTTDGG